MARCMGVTKEGKRCARKSLPKETFCSQHIKGKTVSGKSRKLSAKKCQNMRKSATSPFSDRTLRRTGRTYGQIYTVCRQRMDHLVKRLEARKDLPEHLAKYAKDLKKEWTRTRKVAAPKSP